MRTIRTKYDYRTTLAQIIESIESNEYEFYSDGTLYYGK